MNLFNGWDPIARVMTVGPLAYAALVLLLRVSGKRTLSKMNAFDLVVTIAFGSVLGSILTDDALALATGIAAISVLIIGQLVISFLSVRFPAVESVIKAEPTLLVHDGRLLPDAMRRCRVTESDVMTALRASGSLSLDAVAAVVLEADGSVTVVGEQLPPKSDLAEAAQ